MSQTKSEKKTQALPYWPGGVPEHIKYHHESIKWDFLGEEVKGWQLFLEENFIPGSVTPAPEDHDTECSQRRNLISKWASLSQEARDSYQVRAPLRAKDSWYPEGVYGTRNENIANNMPHAFCNLIVPQPLSPRHKALWAKIRIMLYHMEFEEGIDFHSEGPLFGSDGDMEMCPANPADAPLTAEKFYRWKFVEPARFGQMAMTRTGTIIFPYSEWRLCFVDEESLETGLLLLCDIANNGSVPESTRTRPMVAGILYPLFQMGKPLDWGGEAGHPLASYPLDMELSILDVLDNCKPRFVGDRERLAQDIENNAPGYLAFEEAGNGMAPDYDHANFRDEGGNIIEHMVC